MASHEARLNRDIHDFLAALRRALPCPERFTEDQRAKFVAILGTLLDDPYHDIAIAAAKVVVSMIEIDLLVDTRHAGRI